MVPPKKRAPKKAPAGKKSLGRNGGYDLINNLGAALRLSPNLATLLPGFVFDADQKRNVLSKVQKKAVNEEKKLDNKKFGSIYRGVWKEQDELFSTASARNLIDGLLQGRSASQIPDAEFRQLSLLTDLVSALRIPTIYSGFAMAGGVRMQHPTEGERGFFSRQSGENHGAFDSQRVQYIARAIEAANHAGKDEIEQIKAAMRAAIEFTLNYFTAPVTASNVHPFSTKAKVDAKHKSLQKQLQAREKMKDIYVQLGGQLRSLPLHHGQPTAELREQSWTRAWQQGLNISTTDPYPEAPPSPRRRAEGLDQGTATVVSNGGPRLATPHVQMLSMPMNSSPFVGPFSYQSLQTSIHHMPMFHQPVMANPFMLNMAFDHQLMQAFMHGMRPIVQPLPFVSLGNPLLYQSHSFGIGNMQARNLQGFVADQSINAMQHSTRKLSGEEADGIIFERGIADQLGSEAESNVEAWGENYNPNVIRNFQQDSQFSDDDLGEFFNPNYLEDFSHSYSWENLSNKFFPESGSDDSGVDSTMPESQISDVLDGQDPIQIQAQAPAEIQTPTVEKVEEEVEDQGEGVIEEVAEVVCL